MGEYISVTSVGSRGCYALDVRDSNRLWRYFHERYCVTLVNAGEARWRYRNRDLEASPRGIMLMEPGEVHTNTKIEIPGSFFAVCVTPEHLMALAFDMGIQLPHFRAQFLQAPECVERLRQVLRASTVGDAEEQEEQLCLALSSVLRQAEERKPQRPGRARTKVRKGAALLGECYRSVPWKTVDVREIASEVQMSYHWFVHSFRDEFGLPPYAYVQSLRRSEARSLMASGPTESLKVLRDVAMAAGYADASHMARDFKRMQGVSPAVMARAIHPGWASSSRTVGVARRTVLPYVPR